LRVEAGAGYCLIQRPGLQAVGLGGAAAQPINQPYHQGGIALGDVLVDGVVGEARQGAVPGLQQHFRLFSSLAALQELVTQFSSFFFLKHRFLFFNIIIRKPGSQEKGFQERN
jgi:hypothetical protein